MAILVFAANWQGRGSVRGSSKGLHQRGTTVIVVTHDEGLAERTSRVLRMLDGRIASGGATRLQAKL
ncbi:MAG: hypothetical protein O3A95_02605 [Planctomycetota bacterium]|nr:hypothetical protein [Planctomycetota bacterium]MDA1113174.1 hypothetical protein [Planctomycetota bacterium]